MDGIEFEIPPWRWCNCVLWEWMFVEALLEKEMVVWAELGCVWLGFFLVLGGQGYTKIVVFKDVVVVGGVSCFVWLLDGDIFFGRFYKQTKNMTKEIIYKEEWGTTPKATKLTKLPISAHHIKLQFSFYLHIPLISDEANVKKNWWSPNTTKPRCLCIGYRYSTDSYPRSIRISYFNFQKIFTEYI